MVCRLSIEYQVEFSPLGCGQFGSTSHAIDLGKSPAFATRRTFDNGCVVQGQIGQQTGQVKDQCEGEPENQLGP